MVVAYGRFLPRPVLDLPRYGTVNLHPSLLPELRGPAPVPWAVVRGFRETGVSVIRLVKEMDAGPVLGQRPVTISATETAARLGRRLSQTGADLMLGVLDQLAAGTAAEAEQDHDAATYAPMVTRETARIDWTKDAASVANLIRGMDDTPGAWTKWEDRPVKVFCPEVVKDGVAEAKAGVVLAADAGRGLRVAAADGVVRVGEVQPSGKRRMEALAWVRGRGAGVGDRFS